MMKMQQHFPLTIVLFIFCGVFFQLTNRAFGLTDF